MKKIIGVATVAVVVIAIFAVIGSGGTQGNTVMNNNGDNGNNGTTTQETDKSEDEYMDALRKCTVMEAADIYTTGIGKKSDNVFNDGRDNCENIYKKIYQSDEDKFTEDIEASWAERKNEVIENNTLEYYMSSLGW